MPTYEFKCNTGGETKTLKMPVKAYEELKSIDLSIPLGEQFDKRAVFGCNDHEHALFERVFGRFTFRM